MESKINLINDDKYPCLMELRDSETYIVVLFTSERCGTVIYTKTPAYKLGYYSTTWDLSAFGPFLGSIILRN